MIAKGAQSFCKEDISLIENYEQAINDKNEYWVCHHKFETYYGIKSDELQQMKLYNKRPPNELIFIKKSEHRAHHGKYKHKLEIGPDFSWEKYYELQRLKSKMTLKRLDRLKKINPIAYMSIIHYNRRGVKNWLFTRY